jgi:predicted permease
VRFLRRAPRDRDLDDEIRFHLAEEAKLRAGRGASHEDAARQARRAFGSVAIAKESTRAVWISTRIEQLFQDLRFGGRILTKSPALSATAVILVALVIGGNTTIFSIAHGILRKPAPGVHAKGLLTVSWVEESGQIETHNSYRVFSHFIAQSTTLQPIAAFDFQRITLTHDNGSDAVRAGIVSANYFETLGVRLVKGRSFTAQEAAHGTSGLVVVIAHHLWQNAFQGSDDIVGRSTTLNGQPATIVGVADPEFRGGWFAELADLWVPLVGELRDRLQPNRAGVAVAMFGRLRPGASPEQAHAELTGLWTQLQHADPQMNQKLRLRLVPYSATAGGNSLVATRGNQILAIFAVVTLLTVAIVCANVANLLIARAVVRQRELALRQSLGASRMRIVRSLLAEGLVLSAVAWVVAVLFAWWVSIVVVKFVLPAEAQGPVVMPDLTPDWTVVGYTLVLALLCTIAVTLGPALRTWRQELLPHLKAGEQGVVHGRSRLSRGLVVIQLAFSVLLLTTAGLAYRSLFLADSLDLGFDTSTLLLATVNTAGSADTAAANAALVETLAAGIRRVPGVTGVSYAPGSRLLGWQDFPVRRARGADPLLVVDNRIAAGYFQTLGVPIVAGRDFTPEDRTNSRRRAIVNRQLAEILWPGEVAVGNTLVAGPAERAVELEVVGVVGDAFFTGPQREIHPRFIFFPAADRPLVPGETTFYVRHTGSLDAIAPAVRRALREVDSRVPIANLRSMDSQLAGDASPVRLLTILLTLFAAASLLMAAIGQYAVVAFDGRRRVREFGVRIALGASSQQVIGAVVRESLQLTLIGLLVGFALSVAVASVLSRVLYAVTPTDPPTYLGVFLLLAAASLLACYLPARRAAHIDPLIALRTE